jgi:hypothetical protein
MAEDGERRPYDAADKFGNRGEHIFFDREFHKRKSGGATASQTIDGVYGMPGRKLAEHCMPLPQPHIESVYKKERRPFSKNPVMHLSPIRQKEITAFGYDVVFFEQ